MGCQSCEDELRKLEPYGDISGIGVMISFLLSACLLVIYVFVYYLSVYNPDLDPYRPIDEPNLLVRIPNPVDRTFLRIFRRVCASTWSKIGFEKRTLSWFIDRRAAEKALTKCARLVSDIQIFTAIAILVSGYKEYSCKLQSYHWQMVLYMAWLASTSHMAILSSLRNYLLTHRKQLWWRFSGMFIISTMLLVALGLTSTLQSTGSVFFYPWMNVDHAESNSNLANARLAKCAAPEEEAKQALESKLKLAIFLGYGYGIRVLKLFQGFDDTPRRLSLWLRSQSMRIEKGHGERPEWDPHRRSGLWMERVRIKLLEPLLIAACRNLHIHLDLLTSFLAEVFWLIMSFIWAAMRLIRFRSTADLAEENEWTFGQVFPVVLLIAPVAALISIFSSCSKTDMLPNRKNGNQTNYGSQLIEHRDENAQLQTTRTSGVQVVHQEADEEYEASASFRGASVLAGFTYINIAIFILTGDPASPPIAYVAAAQLWSSAFFQPLYQLWWPLYSLWVPKLNLGEVWTAAMLDFIFLAIFTLVISLPLMQIVLESRGRSSRMPWTSDPHMIAKMEIWGVISLLAIYWTFLGWFALDSRVRRMKPTQPPWLKHLCITLVPLSTSICLVTALIPFYISSFMGGSSLSWLGYWAGAGCVFAYQLLVGLIELAIRRWSRAHARAVRAGSLVLIMASIVAGTYSYLLVYATSDLFSGAIHIPMGNGWLNSVVIASEAWFAFWICSNILSTIIHRR